MRVLVTGHRGYLGTPVCQALAAAGHDVSGLDADFYRKCTFPSGNSGLPAGYASTMKDIRDVQPDDLEGIDALIHLAGLSNDPLGDFNPGLTVAINHRASVRLAALARDAGISRMLLASSCSVYGASNNSVLDEESELAPVTPYARSKLDMELEIGALASDEFSPVFLRSGTVYGISPRIRFDLVVNNLTAWACATGKVRLKSDGLAWRPIVHVRDVARAFAAVLELPASHVSAKALNVVHSNQNYQIRDIAKHIAAGIEGATISFDANASADTRNYRVSGERLKSMIGDWNRMTLNKGIEELVSALADNPVPVDDFEGPRYQRLAHLKALIEQGKLDKTLRWMEHRDRVPA